ncbi:uncharacterized protein LOC113657002 [Tachysurus fulvidraco]|uniref:uncharacterized protein LOC113657002 n=1 Tax=Tachysurus fulvidraco TaxID=1234273 RepID=UPI001FEF8715|nr:uncharacterized protein LOC113657002 [Tachysurus fulvidraco]
MVKAVLTFSPHGRSSPHFRPHSQMSHNFAQVATTVLTCMQMVTALLRSTQVLRPALLCYPPAGMFALKAVHQVNQALRPFQGMLTLRSEKQPTKLRRSIKKGTLNLQGHTRDIQQTSSHQIFLLCNILTKQEMLMDQLRIIFKTLQCMQSSPETEIGLDRNLLPLKDLSSLQNMEDNLQSTPDLHKQLVNTLALKGGTDVQECVWRIMHGLFTDSLARKVNMRGVNGKTGFLRLQIRDVVIAAVRRNCLTSEATEKEIDSTVKRWLYLAPDRDGGRKERMKNKVSGESTTG